MSTLFSFYLRSFSGIPRPVWWLSATQLVNRVGAMAIPFMTLYLTQKLGFGIADAGLVMTIFGLGTIIGSLAGGWLTDRIGYRPIMIWSLVLNGFGFLALLPLRSFWAISALVFLLSIAAEAFRPAASSSIARYSSDEMRTRSFSLYRFAINLGWAIASAIGGLLASFDYSLIFWADALTCLASALFLGWFFSKTRENSSFPKKTAAAKTVLAEAKSRSLPALKNRFFLIFCGLNLLCSMIFMQMVWTVPPFLKEEFHFDEWTIGLVMGLNGVIVFAFEMPLVFQLENRRRTFWFVRLGLFLYVFSYLALVMPGPLMLAAVLSTVAVSFGEIFVMPFNASFNTKYAPPERQGEYMGSYSAAHSISNVLAPLAGTQIIAAAGYFCLWWTTAAASLVAMGGFYFLDKQLKINELNAAKIERATA